jgi:parvulin-like peptidyl-prolyl isomerase
VILPIVPLIISLALPGSELLVDRIVAVVDGQPILASELGASRDTQAAIEQLIEKRLLLAEAKRRGIEVDEAALDQAVEQIRTRNKIPDLATLMQAVQASGRSWQQYRTELKEQLIERQIMGAIMARGTQVTDRELKQAMARQPKLVEQRRLSHLLLRLEPNAKDWEVDDARGRAEALKSRLGSGETFAELAKANSEDPSAGNGGDLGWIGRGLTDPAFEKSAFAGQEGAVVGPVRSAFGIHLIHIVTIRREVENDAQREQLRNSLRQQNARKALAETLRQARQRALVKLLP